MSYSQLTGLTSLTLDALQVSEISDVDAISCGVLGTIAMLGVTAASTLTSTLITVGSLTATTGTFTAVSAATANLEVVQAASLTSTYANCNAGSANAFTVGFATVGSLTVGTFLNFEAATTGQWSGYEVVVGTIDSLITTTVQAGTINAAIIDAGTVSADSFILEGVQLGTTLTWRGSEVVVGTIDTLITSTVRAAGVVYVSTISATIVDAGTVSADSFILDGVLLGTTLDWSDITGKPSQIVQLAEGAAADVAADAAFSVASSAGNSLLSAGTDAVASAGGSALGDFLNMLGGSSDSGNGVTLSDTNGMVGNQGSFQKFTSGTFDASGLVTAAEGIVSEGPVSVQGLMTAVNGLVSQGAAVVDGLLTASSGLSVAGSTVIEGPLLLSSQASASTGLAWATYL